MQVKINFLSNYKHFVFVAIIFLISNATTNSQVKTSFPATDFYIRTNDSLPNRPGYGQSGVNRFRLTTGATRQSTVLWHKEPLDLKKDFILDMRLKFGNDGIVFVIKSDYIPYGWPHPLQQWIGCRNQIGYGASGYDSTGNCHCNFSPPNGALETSQFNNVPPYHSNQAGCWQLRNSYAVKFDTHYGAGCDATAADHISLLKNGCMKPIGNMGQPIKPNGASVKDGEWHCVRIVWKKGKNGNVNGYFLETYVQDGNKTNLRVRQFFNTINDMVTIPQDTTPVQLHSEYKTLWGITSGSAQVYPNSNNIHEVEFISFVSGDNITSSSTYTASIGWNYIPPPGGIIPLYRPDPPTISWKLGDTIQACGQSIISPIDKDTMRYNWANCVADARSLYITVKGIENLASASWSLQNGNSWVSVGTGIDSLPLAPIIDGRDNTIKPNKLLIRLITGSDTLYFEINYRKDGSALADYFSDAANLQDGMEYDKTYGSLTLSLDSNSLEQKIKLPNIEGCNYNELSGFDGEMFATLPEIDEDGVFTFELREGVCDESVSLGLILDCECANPIRFTINAPKCEGKDTTDTTNPCDAIRIIHLGSMAVLGGLASPVFSIGGIVSSIDVVSETKIESMRVNVLEGNSNISVQIFNGTIVLAYRCPSDDIESTDSIFSVEICAMLETGDTCCNTTEVVFSCNGLKLKEGGIVPNPVEDGIATVHYELYELPKEPIPLYMTVYDQFGNQRTETVRTIPKELSGKLNLDVSSLESGNYYIACQYGEQIVAIPFIIKR